jgi:hypothetical protein
MIITNFINHIKKNINEIIKDNLYIYNQYIILWNSEYIYEDANTCIITNKPKEDIEYITHKTQDIFNNPEFQEFLSQSHFKLDLTCDKDILYIKPITHEFNDELSNLSLLFDNIQVNYKNNTENTRKMSIIFNGKLFLHPDREYWINFINNHEYVVYCYEIDSAGKRQSMLFYFFKQITT